MQVILDDLIVDGSACIGLDCVNGGELRLRHPAAEGEQPPHQVPGHLGVQRQLPEQRLAASPPTSPDNGGANKFSASTTSSAGRIPFRVEAGAPVNALYVEADGDLGVKTANPVVDIHVVEGNTPTLRLEQDGSDGFTPQTYDIAANEANFFIRDVTNGSKLFFRAKPGAPEDSIFVAASGFIGLGTDAPAAELQIRGNTPSVRFQNTGSATDIWEIRRSNNGLALDNDTNSTDAVFFDDGRVLFRALGVTETFSLTATGDLTIAGGLITSTAGSCNVGTPL